MVGVVADSARRNVDGEVAVQGGVESGPFVGFGPALIADVALAIIGAPVPCSRHQCSHDFVEQECNQYCLHFEKCVEL